MSKHKPSIDWGYPSPADGPVPVFNNIEEEAEFWDTHGFTEFGELELLSADELTSLDPPHHGDSHNEPDSSDSGQ